MASLPPASQRSESTDPILRWAGSKRKLLVTLKACAPSRFNRYYEPFVGSGTFFFALAPRAAVLGDINHSLMEALEVLRARPVKLHRVISELPRNKRTYYRVRRSAPTQKLFRAARFIYLNRLCFNGLYRTNKQNEFNVPYGYDTGECPSLNAFRRAAACLRNAKLVTGDFETVLRLARREDFVYLDPPYVYSARKDRGEYGNGSFSCADIVRLSQALHRLDKKKVLFLLSYLDCEEVHRHLNGWNVRRIPVQRQIASFVSRRVRVSEILVSNY